MSQDSGAASEVGVRISTANRVTRAWPVSRTWKEAVALQFAGARFQDAVPSPRTPGTAADGLFEGRRRIDWAFIRGPLRANSGQVHGDVKASDHYPISFVMTA